MTAPITITATVAAWLSRSSAPHRVLESVRKGDAVEVMNQLAFYGEADLQKFGDWIRVGEAQITVQLLPEDEQVAIAVQQLRDELEEQRSKWLTVQRAILDRINSLTAITYEPEAA